MIALVMTIRGSGTESDPEPTTAPSTNGSRPPAPTSASKTAASQTSKPNSPLPTGDHTQADASWRMAASAGCPGSKIGTTTQSSGVRARLRQP